jgi:protein-S-isoprenylcysteine O-methyltransferase Ste14
MKLILQTLQTDVIGLVILGALLFIPAGTLGYWHAWVFLVVFTISTNAIGLYLTAKDPALLERRKKIGPASETRPAQRLVMSISILSLAGLFVFCAVDYRFGWSPVPWYVAVLGDGLVALGLFIDLLVFRENSYGGSSIEIVDGQKVISTGPYAVVRHPMYAGVLVMVAGVPLALGSWWGLAILIITTPVLIIRILDEEKFLEKDLPGYEHYAQTVRHRLVPYLW